MVSGHTRYVLIPFKQRRLLIIKYQYDSVLIFFSDMRLISIVVAVNFCTSTKPVRESKVDRIHRNSKDSEIPRKPIDLSDRMIF